MEHRYRRIYRMPQFHALESKRRRFSWLLSGIVCAAYFAFVLVVAFRPSLFGTPLSDATVVTWGMVAGVAIILLSVVLTGVYVFRANREFDTLNRAIIAASEDGETPQ